MEEMQEIVLNVLKIAILEQLNKEDTEQFKNILARYKELVTEDSDFAFIDQLKRHILQLEDASAFNQMEYGHYDEYIVQRIKQRSTKIGLNVTSL